MGGESARATAHTRRERAGELLRSAEAFERGAEGEESSAQRPRRSLAEHRVARLPRRALAGHAPQANIDHVVVGPSGVFVIETK